jgi:hypothetical protein
MKIARSKIQFSLEELARRCEEAPEDSEIEEMHWLGRLQGSDFLVDRSKSNSQ